MSKRLTSGSKKTGGKSPYLVGLTNLAGNPGTRLELDLEFPLNPEWTNGVVGLVGETEDFHVELTSLSEGVLARVTGEIPTTAQCSRCLDEVGDTILLDETQLFFFPEKLEAARQDAGDDAEDVLAVSDENEIDLEPLLRDNLVLSMSSLPLCEPDCQGLCPGCGERWDTLPPDHAHEVIDPRWAALGDLVKTLRDGDEKQ